jgi:hypothetical protein
MKQTVLRRRLPLSGLTLAGATSCYDGTHEYDGRLVGGLTVRLENIDLGS